MKTATQLLLDLDRPRETCMSEYEAWFSDVREYLNAQASQEKSPKILNPTIESQLKFNWDSVS